MLGSKYVGHYNGMQIIELPLIKEYKQNRCHRKKRTNKKWKKRYGVTAIPYPVDIAYVSGDKIICHPKMAIMLKQAERAGIYEAVNIRQFI